MIKDKFRVDILGDLENEDLNADIYFEDQILAVLHQEEGFSNLRINIYTPKNKDFWDFKFEDFEKVTNYAKIRLWELRKMPHPEQDNE